MGTILRFSPEAYGGEKSRKRTRRNDASVSAEILMFTGVRYERHGGAAARVAASEEHNAPDFSSLESR